MSGDVQPRKRRDKKKKKDEFEETTAPHQHFARAPTPPTNNDDVNIHIYKENSTGGGICAKFVFFVLLAILGTLIGLIITEHRGLTHLDTIEAETRFSQLFEGWVDKNADDHDDHDIHPIESHEHDDEDDHEDAHDDEDDHDHEEEEEEHDDEDEHASEEDDEDEKEQSEEATEEDAVATEEDESAQEDDEEEEQSVQDEEESTQQDEDEEDEEVAESEQQDDEEDEQSAPQSEEASQEADDDNASEAEAEDDENEASDAAKDEEDEDEKAESEEQAASEEKSAETGIDEAEDGEEPAEDDDEAAEGDDEAAEGEEDVDNVAVAIRIGVGVTILVVAYVVLVKKWKSDKVEETHKKEEAPLDLSRRNTIVVPPKVEEVEQVIDNDDEEYSEEEIEEDVKLHPKIKQDYQKLRTTYARSLTPESEPETNANKSYDDEYDDEEDEGEYDDEEEVEEEEEEAEEGEDEEAEEEEPLSEPDDEDLMKKFEAKYGKLQANKDEEEYDEEEDEEEEEEEEEEDGEDDPYQWKRVKPSEPAQTYDSDDDKDAWLSGGAQSAYAFENFTNSDDFDVRDQLDNANQHVINNAALAVSLFNKILDKHPKSPRALYGKANSLDNLADQKRSNELLKDAIALYLEVLKLDNVPPALYITTAERCINRMRFMGHYGRAVSVHKLLMQQFPDDIKYSNQLAVTYLTINKIPEARNLLKETLLKWPNNGVALVHYGFILKVNDNNLKEAIKYLKKGLATKSEGVIDGRFYFHLGDALTRLRKLDEAIEVYKDGVENKVFLSRYQRSLYNVNRLTGRPWWNKSQTPYQQFYESLEKNYKHIKQEGLAILNQNGYFQDEAENLRDVGDWKQFELFARGIKHKENCKKCPFTCKIVESLPEAVGCRRGQVKFSVMHPGTHVWPHCGPTNCRLRVHLGLKVPSNTFIRVAEEIRSWEEGKVFIFDDSFEHEVWHNGSQFRLVLIVDVWHPELTVMEKQSLSAI